MSTTSQPTLSRNLETSRWRIDPARSRIEFHSLTLWGLMIMRGRFERYDGTLDLRPEPAIELTMDASSVDTGNKIRDKHLRSSDFFDIERHSRVRFVSETADLDGERLKVSGRLYAAGKSTPLELEATIRQDGAELELDACACTNHRQLGMPRGILGIFYPPHDLIVHGHERPARGEERVRPRSWLSPAFGFARVSTRTVEDRRALSWLSGSPGVALPLRRRARRSV